MPCSDIRIMSSRRSFARPDRAGAASHDMDVVRESLDEHAEETLRLLESAWRIQRAVLDRVTREAQRRLLAPNNGEGSGDDAKPSAGSP